MLLKLGFDKLNKFFRICHGKSTNIKKCQLKSIYLKLFKETMSPKGNFPQFYYDFRI